MPQQTDEVKQKISYLFTETEVKTRKVRGGKNNNKNFNL